MLLQLANQAGKSPRIIKPVEERSDEIYWKTPARVRLSEFIACIQPGEDDTRPDSVLHRRLERGSFSGWPAQIAGPACAAGGERDHRGRVGISARARLPQPVRGRMAGSPRRKAVCRSCSDRTIHAHPAGYGEGHKSRG